MFTLFSRTGPNKLKVTGRDVTHALRYHVDSILIRLTIFVARNNIRLDTTFRQRERVVLSTDTIL